MFASAAQHADEFSDAFFTFDGIELRPGAASDDFFFDHEVSGGCGGDLWEVGDGDDLVKLSQAGHFFTNGSGDLAADVGIDFIEDHQWGGVLFGKGGFDGEHDA